MKTEYPDTVLKQALAKMLPEKVYWDGIDAIVWINKQDESEREVLDTELLHLCWLVEEILTDKEYFKFVCHLSNLVYVPNKMGMSKDCRGTGGIAHATGQQRVIALCKVKGIEI